MDWSDTSRLEALDAQGYLVLEALTTTGLTPSSTYSRPNAFVCIDGRTYWVKSSVQQGLVAELIAGRLADLVGAGPIARIVRVTPEAAPVGSGNDHLHGVVVGSHDQPATVNCRDLAPVLAAGGPVHVDAASRARVVAFQTWLDIGDSQVLVNATDGKVSSIDHGDCFGAMSLPAQPPSLVVTDIPSVPAEAGHEPDHVGAAVSKIERVTDSELLKAVAAIPVGDAWRAPVRRRLEIAAWLAARRGTLRVTMKGW